jgi:hypothetical protein
MNASLSAPLPSSPIIVRNSRVLSAIMILMGAAFLVMSPLLLLVALAEIFPIEGFSFGRLIAILTWIAACAGAASGGWSILRTALNMTRNTAYLDGNGIEFTLRLGKTTRQEFVRWNHIVSIQQQAMAASSSSPDILFTGRENSRERSRSSREDRSRRRRYSWPYRVFSGSSQAGIGRFATGRSRPFTRSYM